jgi:quinoprotein glucose dehydrogenase
MLKRRSFRLTAIGLLGLTLALTSIAGADKEYSPSVGKASDEGARAMKRFRVPKGVEARLWAAEPLLANPVSFCFDEKGRCFVAETFRLHRGVTDNRNHNSEWLDDDLACRSVADRVAMYRKHLKDKFASYEVDHDRVKLIEDTKGAGVADRATVFADGFHTAAEGIGAGVLARKGNVYYTCIPDVWLLRDTKGAGKADERKSLASGFGVHTAFIGHDLHGLRMGPDGKLYFSCADRGLNVKTKEGKHLFNPDSGAVLRCDSDGSNLEIVAVGLRNPQELAFDQYGNLFTVDNNSDSGDKARLVYIVEGGDSGWRTGYQYGSDMGNRGPFNAEKIWHLQDYPAYIVPPLAHVADGPSGLCFNYGATAMPDRYTDHFFLADFRGTVGISGIRSFAVKPKGAAFEMVDQHECLWSILATDVDFGPDGGLYVSDWVSGWGLTGKGRLYRFADPETEKKPAVAEVKKLLAEGFEKRPIADLAKYLEHADLRVRQEAQFALAEKGKDAIETLAKVAKESNNRLARLHAIWGLGQIGRTGEKVSPILKSVLKDVDDEVRGQAARVYGWLKEADGNDLLALLKDVQVRVRFQALQSLGKTSVRIKNADTTWDALVELVKENADRDAYLRHAASVVMSRYPGQSLVVGCHDKSPAVRMASVLALRYRKNPVVWPALDDGDPKIAIEAARAIHDAMLPGEGIALAERLGRPKQPEEFAWRALNANFRLGEVKNAAAVAAYAANGDAPEKLRVEAIKMLGDWAKPKRRDYVTGLTQDLGMRKPEIAVAALTPRIAAILAGPDRLCQEAARVASTLGIKEVAPALAKFIDDPKRSPELRIESLLGLERLGDERLDHAVTLSLKDKTAKVRTEGRAVLARTKPERAVELLSRVLKEGSIADQQGAYAILGDLKAKAADDTLAVQLDRLLKSELTPEVHLDLLDAAAKHPTADIKAKLARFEAARAKNDHLAGWRESLVGGDAVNGRKIFFNKQEVYCMRCHKVKNEGGDVGPDLTGIGARQKRDYLLESIVDPNKVIAKGFDTVVLDLKNGKTVSGVLKEETGKEIRLMTAEAKLIVVLKADVEERTTGKSAMPEDLIKKLTRSELRDLVEFLANLKEPAKPK